MVEAADRFDVKTYLESIRLTFDTPEHLAWAKAELGRQHSDIDAYSRVPNDVATTPTCPAVKANQPSLAPRSSGGLSLLARMHERVCSVR